MSLLENVINFARRAAGRGTLEESRDNAFKKHMRYHEQLHVGVDKMLELANNKSLPRSVREDAYKILEAGTVEFNRSASWQELGDSHGHNHPDIESAIRELKKDLTLW